MPPNKSPTTIPLFYRIFFQYIDPAICIWGASMDFFTPTVVLSSHIPNLSADIGHTMILKQRGGAMLNFAIISALLLRYTYDLKIWDIVQVAFFIVDLALYWATYEVLNVQGRLSPRTWRAEDWGSIGITVVAGATRAAFLTGFGLERDGKRAKRAKKS